MGGQGIPGGAAVELAEFQQPEHTGGNLPLHFHGPGIKFRTGHERIHTLGSFGDVGGLAVNVQSHLAGTGHQLLSAAEHPARFQARPQVQAEHRLHPVSFQHTGIADGFGTAGAFLAGLEDQQNVMAQLCLPIQPPGQLQQDGHMAVMAAGVHNAGVGGGVSCSGFFLDGQGIHIRPEGDRLLRPEVKPGAQSAAQGREHPAGEGRQGIFQILFGLRQVPFQLRDPVECMTVSVYLHKKPLLRKIFFYYTPQAYICQFAACISVKKLIGW